MNDDWIIGSLTGKTMKRNVYKYVYQGQAYYQPGREEHEIHAHCILSPTFPIREFPKIMLLDLQLFTIRGLGGMP